MPTTTLTGTRLRARRLDLGVKQADLARSVGISASYLNLIEHNRRRIGGKLLGRLAEFLSVDPASLSEGANSAVLQGLGEIIGALNPHRESTTRIASESPEDFADRFPGWAAQSVAQHRRIAGLEATIAGLADRMSHDPHLSSALHDILSSVTAIRSTSTILTGEERPDPAWQARFQRNIHEESARLATASQALARYLATAEDARPGTASPQEELEVWLSGRNWHVAELESQTAPDIEALVHDPGFRATGSRRIARRWLSRTFDDAQSLPISTVSEFLADGWPDPGAMVQRLHLPLSLILRRLAALPEQMAPGAAGLLIADGAGALTFRRPLDGFPLPRIGAGCPLWPLFEALQRPGQPVRAIVELPGTLARRFQTYAAVETLQPGTFTDPPVVEATMLILPLDGAEAPGARQVGSACRVCPRTSCAARREPSVLETPPDTISF